MATFAPIVFDASLLGMEYALLAVGVYISFRILNMADLTVDGSFGFGMAVSAVCAVGGQPWLGIVLGTLAGALAGSITGLLVVKAKINSLLAGIVVMTGLYSVTTYVLGGPNVSLLDASRIWQAPVDLLASVAPAPVGKFALVTAVVLAVVMLLSLFFQTEAGLSLRATGDNEAMCRASSINTGHVRICGLALANALVGMTGAILAQYQGFADVSSGSGMVMIGLASVIVGELLVRSRHIGLGLLSAVVGSIVYRLAIQLALALNIMDPHALKLVTAAIVALFMSLPALQEYLQRKFRAKSLEAEEGTEPTLAPTQAESRLQSVLQLMDVRKIFSPGTAMEHLALDKVSLEVKEGDFACIIGSNGAGKSTLFEVISGSQPLDGGRVFVAGKDVSKVPDYVRARKLSRVFQDPMRGTSPHLTVAENVALAYGRSTWQPFAFALRKERRDLIHQRLKELGFGLEERMDTEVGLLSGGQRQAVTLLMSTIGNPDLLLLDEHTAALDPAATERILELTSKISSERKITTLMITHDLNSALTMGNRTIVMDGGHVVANLDKEARAGMTVQDLLRLYREASGKDLSDDKVLLS